MDRQEINPTTVEAREVLAHFDAVGAAAGTVINRLVARHIREHHADFLEERLSLGLLLVTVDVSTEDLEKRSIAILEKGGATKLRAHTILRYDTVDHRSLQELESFEGPQQ